MDKVFLLKKMLWKSVGLIVVYSDKFHHSIYSRRLWGISKRYYNTSSISSIIIGNNFVCRHIIFIGRLLLHSVLLCCSIFIIIIIIFFFYFLIYFFFHRSSSLLHAHAFQFATTLPFTKTTGAFAATFRSLLDKHSVPNETQEHEQIANIFPWWPQEKETKKKSKWNFWRAIFARGLASKSIESTRGR